MKTDWIEDFLALADAGTFSRAAALRNVTQPAFSRRIQLLESWMGVELIDRRTQPMRLTSAAQRHIADFRALLQDLNQLRNRLRAEENGVSRVLLTTQHSLTMTRLPALLQLLMKSRSNIEFNVRAENRDECVALFMRGQADLLLCMEEADDLLTRVLPVSDRICLGTETLIPLSAPGKGGRPMHAPRVGQSVKLLSFPDDSFMGRIMNRHCIGPLLRRYSVEVVHESVFLAGIKEMIIAGLGMAWLPQSLVTRELEAKKLVILDNELKGVTVELGLYRSTRSAYPEAINRIWQLLKEPSA